jgi:LmbE family N-acetylglucosaminyl deacetylase
MRWIYISPHLDDAVLSAGGLIYAQTRADMDVEIWTILSGFPSEPLSPFAQQLHQRWGISAAADLINARRAEDIRAAKIVRAKTSHFDFLDCIYRRGKGGDWLYTDIFVPPHEDEANSLTAQIADLISTRLNPDDQLVCPLGVGSHVDHILVRRAVELLPRATLYYADVPYLFKTPREFESKTTGMRKIIRKTGKKSLKAWQYAIAKYASQIGELFERPEKMRAQIASYWSERKGVPLWSA